MPATPGSGSDRRRSRTFLCLLLAAALTGVVGGCAAPGYYLSLASGQRALLQAREPIAEVLADPARDEDLKRRLALIQDLRRFASAVLQLPRNRSYTSYVELQRPYVVWNVFATPEFALAPRTWCHLLVGCLAYRGYFSEAAAQAFAGELRAAGDDVYVGGVPAYSSLGWFDDPVVSSMLRWDDDALLGTILHELAHQMLFVPGDTRFNESLASFIEAEGLRQFRLARNEAPPEEMARRREQAFIKLVLQARSELAFLYDLPLRPQAMRAEKGRVFERLRRRYAALKASWGGYSGYDAWMAGELNNAKLLPIGLYHEWQAAFAELFQASGRDWAAFHDAVRKLSRLDPARREQRMRELLAPA